ncbi:MAG: 2-hydroxychromene-2-carboxylate isomerase [Alphaproteobacteria bacterium]|nr:2-hydroxychromene-2-carboxylate isomerase [Alphaproteobacteria bacterium]
MTKVHWYFDFISPFSYLQHELLHRLPDTVEIVYEPVLFAGLLGRWGHKGPAEIPGKRLYTNRYCVWFAQNHGIPFKMPPKHPYNPLKALRLAIALDADPEAVATIFHFIWQEGRWTESAEDWAELTGRLGLADADDRIADPAVKDRLRENTEQAAAKGVFGVPTFLIGDTLFWGVESTEMVVDYLKDPTLLEQGEMARLPDLPSGAERPR